MALKRRWRNWRARVARQRAERIAAMQPVVRQDAYIDPDLITRWGSQSEWLRRVALAHARRDAAVAKWGPDPLHLRTHPQPGSDPVTGVIRSSHGH